MRMHCTFDNRDRDTLCDWSDPNTPDVSKSYDAAGRMLTQSSSVSRLTYTYNNPNELLSETQDIAGFAGGAKTLNYTYNADVNRESLNNTCGKPLKTSSGASPPEPGAGCRNPRSSTASSGFTKRNANRKRPLKKPLNMH